MSWSEIKGLTSPKRSANAARFSGLSNRTPSRPSYGAYCVPSSSWKLSSCCFEPVTTYRERPSPKYTAGWVSCSSSTSLTYGTSLATKCGSPLASLALAGATIMP